jgi:hypothetical protein
MDESVRQSGSFTLDEWCVRRRISRAMFYKLPDEQRPRTHNVGTRVLISTEADAAWVRAREAEAEPQTAA